MCFLSSGNEVVKMGGAAKTCEKQFHVPKKACDNRECVVDCINTYGDVASGRCGDIIEPDDVCVCSYPC